jgi:chromosome condensin MukBEF complex kleisin-like MukF subunit
MTPVATFIGNLRLGILLGLVFLAAAIQRGSAVSWTGEKLDTWRGYKRHVFKVDGCGA